MVSRINRGSAASWITNRSCRRSGLRRPCQRPGVDQGRATVAHPTSGVVEAEVDRVGTGVDRDRRVKNREKVAVRTSGVEPIGNTIPARASCIVGKPDHVRVAGVRDGPVADAGFRPVIIPLVDEAIAELEPGVESNWIELAGTAARG